MITPMVRERCFCSGISHICRIRFCRVLHVGGAGVITKGTADVLLNRRYHRIR